MPIPKILVVVSEKFVALDIVKRLEILSYNVVATLYASDDIASFILKLKPDLVMLDFNIKGAYNGIESAELIKQSFDIPVIMLGMTIQENLAEIKTKSIESFRGLNKPFDFSDLKCLIEFGLYKKKTERKIRENEYWFKAALSNLQEGIIAVDEFDNIKLLNSVAENLTGYKFDECLGKEIDEKYAVYPDTSIDALILLSLNLSSLNGEKEKVNKILISNLGKQIPIEEKISIVRNEAGEIIGKIFSFRDITKEREMVIAAHSAKNYYLNILEKFPVMIWRADVEGKFNYFNTKWLEFTGHALELEVSEGWLQNIHPEDKSLFLTNFEYCFRERKKLEIEFRILGADREYKWLMCVANPLMDINSEFAGFLGVCFDLTNRKNIEDELRSAKNLSDMANRTKTTFISNMSHEIRTPLNGIMGLTDLLLGMKFEKEQTEYLEMIKQSSHTLLGLLNNLLDFSKIESNKENLYECEFILEDIISEIYRPFLFQTKRTGVNLELRVDKKLPSRLFGDCAKIQRILSNLISNALKFTQKGSVKIDVAEYRLSEKEKLENSAVLLHISVTDTGIGIPQEKQSIIFESFTQVDDSRTRRYSGSGLGLAIVKKLVELMGGRIWLVSEPGKGSCFEIIVKLKKV